MTSKLSRRHFLKQSGAASAMAVGASSWMANLAALSSAEAASGSTYKALVCIFLYGANDNFNTVLPLDAASWSEYERRRRAGTGSGDVSLVLDQASLPRITPTNTGVQLGLHPSLVQTASLFTAGKLAVVANVGPLTRATTREDYKAGKYLPAGLYSHNDQQVLWQSGKTNLDPAGWGGRFAELKVGTGVQKEFLSINTSSNTPFVYGDTLNPYNLTNSPSGAARIGSATLTNNQLYGGISRQYLLNLIQGATGAGKPVTNLLEKDYIAVTTSSINAEVTLNTSLTPITLAGGLTRPTTQMGREMEAIARMIKLQAPTGGRQVFFVGMGGFDLHDREMEFHPGLLTAVDNALGYFNAVLEAEGLSENVTTFTASEFGRKLSTNGDGTDHGWGGHHFVMGGAVAGGKLYGRMPSYEAAAPGSGNSFADPYMLEGDGVMLPYVSTDQYASTLGKWFGNFTDTQIKTLFPNVFGTLDLGLFNKTVV